MTPFLPRRSGLRGRLRWGAAKPRLIDTLWRVPEPVTVVGAKRVSGQPAKSGEDRDRQTLRGKSQGSHQTAAD